MNSIRAFSLAGLCGLSLCFVALLEPACTSTASNDGSGAAGAGGDAGSGAVSGNSGGSGATDGGSAGTEGGSAGNEGGSSGGSSSGGSSGSNSGGSAGDGGSGGGGRGGDSGSGGSDSAGGSAGTEGGSAGSAGTRGGSGGDAGSGAGGDAGNGAGGDGGGGVGGDAGSGGGGSGGDAGSGPTGGSAGVGGSGNTPCSATSECAVTEFCDFPDDEAACGTNATGQCAVRPSNCDIQGTSVCGCDGERYASECAAQAAGWDVSNDANCPCSDSSECPPDEWCDEGGCDVGTGNGSCVARPLGCDGTVSPVCGCDGVTYDSACEANSAGVGVADDDECPCWDNQDCAPSQFCKKANPNICSVDTIGKCATACSTTNFDYVCGCDSKTYVNECAAEQAGVNVADENPCPCSSNSDCQASEYCNKGFGNCAVGDDGFCVPRPTSCNSSDLQPVCGCNNQGYANAECAAKAGVTIKSNGPC